MPTPHPFSGSLDWHAPAQPRRAGQGLLLLMLGLAACSSAEPQNPGTGGHGGSDSPVSCGAANNGDPCAHDGESCGPAECFGCSKTCVVGRWLVHCTEPPPCPTEAPAQGSACDSFCGPTSCGPYTVQTTCGPETVQSQCGTFGWLFPTTCKVDCISITDETACDGTLGCLWAKPCSGSDVLQPLCMPVTSGADHCGSGCPDGTACADLAVNFVDPKSGDCTNAGVLVNLCLPAATP
ncbi:MAG: hypothetical protein QM820_61875 [Minicystis sp.]